MILRAISFFGILGILYSLPTQAFVSVRSSQSGQPVRWPEGSNLTFRTNTANSSRLSATDIFNVFTTALARWKLAAIDGFSFRYFQGTDATRYPNYLGSPEDNSIFFTSSASSADGLPCGVIALTQVWFDPGSGIAGKADIRFNDNCYQFTLNPSDTRSQSRIYLPDVAVHELGHALGLDHTQNLQSSMTFTATVQMAQPSCDDRTAMLALYGGGNRGRTGTITGRVVSPEGSPIFGASVSLIQMERGTVISNILSDRDGGFRSDGLEPGNYGVLVEPFFPGSNALGPYYSGINNNVCSGAVFQRTFVLDGGRMKSFVVDAGGGAGTGDITVKCQAPTSANGFAETSTNSAPVLTSEPIDSPVATQSVLYSGNSHYYRLANQSGTVVVHAIAYTMFSRADVSIDILDQFGNRISQSASPNVFSNPPSGYVNFDAVATATLSSAQDIYVRVSSTGTLSNSNFPSGALGVSGSPYYVITASRGTRSDAIFPDNARCESADLFAQYVSEGEAPAFNSSDDDDDSSSGCGTITSHDSGGPMGPGGVNRLLNFAAMLMMLALGGSLIKTKSQGKGKVCPL